MQLTSAEGVLTEIRNRSKRSSRGPILVFLKTAFRTFCDRGALAETRIRFDKALKPQACPSGRGGVRDTGHSDPAAALITYRIDTG